MLNEDLLREYCEGFFGYGNPQGKYWFIGPEEAGGHSEAEVQERLELWTQHPQPRQIIDGFEFHRARRIKSQKDSFFKFQKTWDRLIRVQLSVDGQSDIKHRQVLAFKAKWWARARNGENCLLELLPLPRQRMRDWLYGKWTRDPTFQSWRAFKDAIIDHRIKALGGLIFQNKPKIVILYGMKQLDHWEAIIGKEQARWEYSKFRKTEFHAMFKQHGGTVFALMYHPNSRGITHEYFQWVGEKIGKRL